jgi:hypothetical protein
LKLRAEVSTPGGTAAGLRRLAARPQPRLSLGDFLETLGDQSFGFLLFVLALPNALPGPLIPGLSVPFALAIAALGLQLAWGLHVPRLPGWMRRWSLPQQRFRRLVGRSEPLLLRLERWLRPRRSPLTEAPGERLIGVALVGLSLVLALPIPFGNTPVALSVMLIGLGQLEGDGIALMVGLAAATAAVLWNAALVFAGAELLGAVVKLM